MAPGDANWTRSVSSAKIDGSPTVLPDGAIAVQSLEPITYVFEPDDGSLRWEYVPDEGSNDVNMFNGVMFIEDRMYFGSRTNALYGLNSSDGSEIGTISAGGTSDDSTPILFPDGTLMCSNDDDNWYFFDEDMNVQDTINGVGNLDCTPAVDSDGYAYGANHGTLHKFDSDANIEATTSFSGVGSGNSPALSRDENTLYFPTGSGIVAFDPSDLSTKWTSNGGQSPATVDDDQGTVYVGNSTVYAIDADDGSTKWTYDVSGGGNSANGVALDTEGKIYKLGGDGVVYCLDAAGNLQWEYDTGSSLGDLFSCPAIDGEQLQLYVGDNSGVMHAIEVDAPAKYEYTEAIEYPFYFQNFRHNAARIQSDKVMLLSADLGLRGGTVNDGNQAVMYDGSKARVRKRSGGGDQVAVVSDSIGQG